MSGGTVMKAGDHWSIFSVPGSSCILYLILLLSAGGWYQPHLTDYETGSYRGWWIGGTDERKTGVSIKCWNWPETNVDGVVLENLKAWRHSGVDRGVKIQGWFRNHSVWEVYVMAKWQCQFQS